MELKCKNCGKVLSGRWKNFCSRRCGGLLYIKTHHKETDIEKKVREFLESKSIQFKTQESIGKITIPDFIIGNTCLYCDGDYWHSSPRKQYLDRRINERLEKLGYKVLRYKGSQILKEFDKVAQDILTNLNDSVPNMAKSAQGS